MDDITLILKKLNSIDDFKDKNEEYLISSLIDVCEEIIEKDITPSPELIVDLNKILDLFES